MLCLFLGAGTDSLAAVAWPSHILGRGYVAFNWNTCPACVLLVLRLVGGALAARPLLSVLHTLGSPIIILIPIEKTLDIAQKMRLASCQRRETFTSTPAASCSRAHPLKFRYGAAESCETASLNLSAPEAVEATSR